MENNADNDKNNDDEYYDLETPDADGWNINSLLV